MTNPPRPLRIRATSMQSPDIKRLNSIVLSDGPRARKEVTYVLVTDRNTGELHHDQITIKTYRKVQGTWHKDRKHSVSIGGTSADELEMLIDFIRSARSEAVPNKTGTFVVLESPVGTRHAADIQKAFNQLSADGQSAMLADVLRQASMNPKLLEAVLVRAQKDPLLFAEAAAALNLATYRQAVDELRHLIETSNREQDFQKLLGQNPWMFGSEYSELLQRRKWTRDENADFVLRKTSDGYIELVEIKTPITGTSLFNLDKSHDSYYPGNPLSVVIGQVMNYIEKLDCDRNAIKANDGEDTCKIRAKIVIGRDGDVRQQEALRRLNGHLHRIEVFTFDQLLRITEKVLSYLESALHPAS